MLKNIDNKFEESRRSTLPMSNVPKPLIDKIHKLLELSNISKNNSESEAYAALLKAQELMVKYHLELSDVYNSKTEDIIKISCEHKYDYKFRYALAGIIAKNFRVRHMYRENSVCFMGINQMRMQRNKRLNLHID